MAANNLPNCLPTIFLNEGGLSMVRADRGNWTGGEVGKGVLKGTNMGIAASAHPSEDIAHLTKARATEIYKEDYWRPAGCEALELGIDLSHLDGTVNSGRKNSAKWLAAARKAGLAGSASIHAYAAARLHSFESFKDWATFGKAWSTRISRVEAASLKMALGSAAPSAVAAVASKAATRAQVATATAHVGTGTAVVSIAEAVHAHPVASGLAALASVGWTIFASFFASGASARATALKTVS